MLTFNQIDNLPNGVVDIISDTERSIIQDMARRMERLGGITDSTLYQYERLLAVSTEHDFIVRELAKTLDKTEAELTQMFDKAATATLASDDAIYHAAGLSPVPLVQNAVMQQIIRAGLDRTMNTFRNLTGTTARTATQQFERALDLAQTQIVTGGMSYQQAIKNGIKSLTGKGIEVIRYPTGHTDYLDVAFRRAAMTGASQMSGQVQGQRMDEMGCNVVETSAHSGARPEHAEWQGKRFYWSEKGGRNIKGYPDFIRSTGYGTGPGLKGWNCGHEFFPVPDINAPMANTAKHLKELNDETVTYNGKTMSQYDAGQQQRAIERSIRKYKREQSAFPKGSEEYQQATAKVREWQGKQRDFIDQTGRRRDYFRERGGTQLGGGVRLSVGNGNGTMRASAESALTPERIKKLREPGRLITSEKDLKAGFQEFREHVEYMEEPYKSVYRYYAKNTELRAEPLRMVRIGYDTQRDILIYNPRAVKQIGLGSNMTFSHELAHRYDVLAVRSWGNQAFTSSINTAMQKVASNPEKYNTLYRSLSGVNPAFQDILGAVSDNKIKTRFGHGVLDAKTTAQEIFANFSYLKANHIEIPEFDGLTTDIETAFLKLIAEGL